jgi:hypothetical protein
MARTSPVSGVFPDQGSTIVLSAGATGQLAHKRGVRTDPDYLPGWPPSWLVSIKKDIQLRSHILTKHCMAAG